MLMDCKRAGGPHFSRHLSRARSKSLSAHQLSAQAATILRKTLDLSRPQGTHRKKGQSETPLLPLASDNSKRGTFYTHTHNATNLQVTVSKTVAATNLTLTRQSG